VDGLVTKEENDRFNESLRTLMGQRLNFNPEDQQALWIYNAQSDYVETMKIFSVITFMSLLSVSSH
jgi:putative ABC transport system permease protein